MLHVSYMLHHPAPHVPHTPDHTPSIAFRHLPPNSAMFGYATEGALFISAQLSTDAVSALRKVWVLIKLQALVYDILPSTTAVFSYATGSRKLSANEQFFVGAQTVVSLLQTTQIKPARRVIYSRQQSLHQHK